jgi:hypothetical protein
MPVLISTPQRVAKREPEQDNLRAFNNAANTIAGRAESAFSNVSLAAGVARFPGGL